MEILWFLLRIQVLGVRAAPCAALWVCMPSRQHPVTAAPPAASCKPPFARAGAAAVRLTLDANGANGPLLSETSCDEV